MRRAILICAMLVSAPAMAIDFLYADTEGGSQIILSNTQCDDAADMYVARNVLPNGQVWKLGCWRKLGDVIDVQWDGGERYAYDGKDFKLTVAACDIMLQSKIKRDIEAAELLGCEREEH